MLRWLISAVAQLILTKEPLSVFTAKHTMYSVLLDSTEVKVGSKPPGKLN